MRGTCHLELLLVVGLTLGGPIQSQADSRPPIDVFTDLAAASGLDFVHFNGMSGEFYYPEMVGSGAALFDFDNDGDLDAYVVQGTMMGRDKTFDDVTHPPRYPSPLTDRLYRNDSEPGSGTVRFTDVTAEAGITASFYGMGVTTGDYDNDGWTDLYLSNFGPNQLLRNRGNGTFEDATAVAGVGDTRWSVATSFFDYDGDGWLDLFAANYVDFTYAIHKICTRSAGARDYCGPLAYEPQPDRLFRNRGDGTFEDVSIRAGINAVFGGALGAVTADFNGDGLIDIYVANDMTPNQLWLNQGDGTFLDDAMLAGAAVNRHGQPEASMGVVGEDFDNDGDTDLFMAHLMSESNTLFVNQGTGFFQDRTLEHGLGTPSWNFTGFGTGWFDFDNDGQLDILVVNGEVKAVESLVQARDPYPLHQPNQLYWNAGDGTYREITDRGGDVFHLSEVSRGAAFGDIDNDGDVDVLVVNNAGPARLLVNQVGSRSAWIGLRMVGQNQPRDMIGTRVALLRDGQSTLYRRVHSDSSYASASDLRVHFGLGEQPTVTAVEVVWPSGVRERFTGLEAGRYHEIVEGSGEQLGPAT